MAATILNCAANKILVDSFFLVDLHIFDGFKPRSGTARVCVHNKEIYPVFPSGWVKLHTPTSSA